MGLLDWRVMTESFRALCSDFYVNQKLSVKLDLPTGRETTLDLFERVRKQFGGMSSFKRYRDELALESGSGSEGPQRWLAVKNSNIRSGVVNPVDEGEAYGLHRAVLELAPFFLSISPLDIEYLEILYGFDLAAGGNQDAIVANALLGGSPLEGLLDVDRALPVDFQPLIGLIVKEPVDASAVLDESLGLATEAGGGGESENASRRSGAIEVHFEVKTRSSSASRGDGSGEPISVYATLRSYEPVRDLKDLPGALDRLSDEGRSLIEQRVLPCLVTPIREAIGSGGF